MPLCELAAAALTPRERDVAKLLLCGCADAEIAKALKIKKQTVKAYMTRIALKCGLVLGGDLHLRVKVAMILCGVVS
jgi:DNA-binding NarL/FixJ family response regulator